MTFRCQYGYTMFWFPLQAIFSCDIPVSIPLYQVLICVAGHIFTWHFGVSTVIPYSDFHYRRYFHATFPCQYRYTKFWFQLQAIFSRNIPVWVRLYQVLISITGDIFTRHSRVSTVIPSSDFHYRRYFHATFPPSVRLYQVLISIAGDIFTRHSRVSTVIPSSDFHCRRYFHATFPCE